jgi:hypothetical protein
MFFESGTVTGTDSRAATADLQAVLDNGLSAIGPIGNHLSSDSESADEDRAITGDVDASSSSTQTPMAEQLPVPVRADYSASATPSIMIRVRWRVKDKFKKTCSNKELFNLTNNDCFVSDKRHLMVL